MGTYTVICQKWEESEAGWGTRPDGYSLHLNEQIRGKYIHEYWEGMPDSVPPEYSRPDGTPYLVDIDSDTFKELQENEGSLRGFGRAPGSGGTNGWMAVEQPSK